MPINVRVPAWFVFLLSMPFALVVATEPKPGEVTFRQADGSLQLQIGGEPVAEYVFDDEVVRRPYFRHLRTRSGVQITRTHPPVKGVDIDDHPTMHPGLWLAFGDLGGEDFWRNKGRVRHIEFVQQPQGDAGTGSFVVRNRYESASGILCIEDCEIVITTRPEGYLLDWRSTFRSEQADFHFGDQEEMGLGVRLATSLTVTNGGTILDSERRKNGAEVWGKSSEWCQYFGTVGQEQVGIVLMPHPNNFRPCWFHARDYGLLVANPIGANAFNQGEKSRITVKRGEDFRLRFGVFIYGVPDGKTPDVAGVYSAWIKP